MIPAPILTLPTEKAFTYAQMCSAIDKAQGSPELKDLAKNLAKRALLGETNVANLVKYCFGKDFDELK